MIIRLPNTGPRTSREVEPSVAKFNWFIRVVATPVGERAVLITPPGVCVAYCTPFAQPNAAVPAGRVAPNEMGFPELPGSTALHLRE